MNIAKIMKEYRLQKNRTHLTRGVLQIMSSRIVWSRYLEPGESYTKTDNMCIYCFVSSQTIGEHLCTYKRFEYCSYFEQKGGCKNTKCKNYKNYLNYYEAKNENEIAEQKLAKYPLWVRFLGIFQRS